MTSVPGRGTALVVSAAESMLCPSQRHSYVNDMHTFGTPRFCSGVPLGRHLRFPRSADKGWPGATGPLLRSPFCHSEEPVRRGGAAGPKGWRPKGTPLRKPISGHRDAPPGVLSLRVCDATQRPASESNASNEEGASGAATGDWFHDGGGAVGCVRGGVRDVVAAGGGAERVGDWIRGGQWNDARANYRGDGHPGARARCAFRRRACGDARRDRAALLHRSEPTEPRVHARRGRAACDDRGVGQGRIPRRWRRRFCRGIQPEGRLARRAQRNRSRARRHDFHRGHKQRDNSPHRRAGKLRAGRDTQRGGALGAAAERRAG